MKELLYAFQQFLLQLMRPRPPKSHRPQPPPNIVVQPADAERSKEEAFYDVMMHRLDRQFELYDRQAHRATEWASISALVVTFLTTIIAVERADINERLGALLIAGFVFFLIGMGLFYAA